METNVQLSARGARAWRTKHPNLLHIKTTEGVVVLSANETEELARFLYSEALDAAAVDAEVVPIGTLDEGTVIKCHECGHEPHDGICSLCGCDKTTVLVVEKLPAAIAQE